MHSVIEPGRSVKRARTLIAAYGKVWVWPGIPLASRYGDTAIVESVETIRFWTARLHGPEALYVETAHHVARAADHIAVGHENSAQLALDTIGLDRLSPDGAALISAVAKRLEVPRPDWPVRPGPRFWETDDIMQQAAFFEEFFDRTATLAKVIPFDPLKHPRWPTVLQSRKAAASRQQVAPTFRRLWRSNIADNIMISSSIIS